MPVSLSLQNFDDQLNLTDPELRNKKVIILVHRPGCMWCEKYMPDYINAEKANSDPSIVFAHIDTSKNPQFLETVRSLQGQIPFKIDGVPSVISYYNGQFYSTYEDSRDGKTYRSIEDTLEYANGIGSAPITYL